MNKRITDYWLPITNKGFTLIELLVVIAIIAILVAFAVANYVGVRSRANDIKKKTELSAIKNALRLYYNDNAMYPGPSTQTSNTLSGCGSASPPSDDCMTACAGQFAVGPTGCDIVYMKQLPPASDYTWNYAQRDSGDDFCLWATLETTSDAEIANSQAKCSSQCSLLVDSNDYVVCAD
jgi:prepilin-type N-terminal cleavage/methylation domain-containing protein